MTHARTLEQPPAAALFVVGCWGAGKSTLGRALAARGMRHVELDGGAGGDAIDRWNVRREWERLLAGQRPRSLVDALHRASGAAPGQRIVVTLPGSIVFDAAQLLALASARLAVVALYGSAADILAGYLEREGGHGDADRAEDWLRGNTNAYGILSLPMYKPYRVESFARGRFVGGDALAAVAVARMDRHALLTVLA